MRKRRVEVSRKGTGEFFVKIQGIGGMALECCNKEILHTEIRYFRSENKYPVRYLEWGICPKCGATRAVLHRENDAGEYKPIKPNKTKNALAFVKDLLQTEQFYEFILLKVKQGSKANMQWKYNHQGIIKDFNGEKRGQCQSPIFISTFSTI